MVQNLPTGQLRIEHHVLRQVTDVLGYLRIAGMAAKHGNRSLVGVHEPQDQLDTGCLTGPVMAEQPQNLPRLQSQVDPRKDRALVVPVTHILKTKTAHRFSG